MSRPVLEVADIFRDHGAAWRHAMPDTSACVTSTVSGNGDQGADLNKLVIITDILATTSLPPAESFTTIRTASFAEVLRGVSFTPGTAGSH
jgi:hypothetical protein